MKNFVLFYQKYLPDGNFISIRRSFKCLKSLFTYLNYEYPNIDLVDFSIFEISLYNSDDNDDNKGFKLGPFSLFGGSDE